MPEPGRDVFWPLSQIAARGHGSVGTVLVAFGSNLVVAIAKSVAAVVTGSASLLAEAAHSWADTGNEVLLIVANAAVSVTHGVQELVTPEPASDFVVGYVVLAVSFVFEGISFATSVRQT